MLKKRRSIDNVTPNFSNFTEEELVRFRRIFNGEITKEEVTHTIAEIEKENEARYWRMKNWVEIRKWDDGHVIGADNYKKIVKDYNLHRESRIKKGKPV